MIFHSFYIEILFDENSHYICSSDFTTNLDPFYGNCFTFNQDGSKKINQAGPGIGLDLEIFVENYEYVSYMATETGQVK